MPKQRYFTITQERKVKIQASEVIDAARIANAIFEGVPVEDLGEINGRPTSNVEVTEMTVREDY